MEQDENTLETQEETQEGQPVTVEETGAEEAVTDSQGEAGAGDPEALLAKAQAEAAKYRRLFEKTQKPKPQGQAPQQASPQASVEETVLLAQGMPEELLAELKAVAQVRRTSLLKAQNDPIFVAVKEKFEKDQKKDDASLRASRGAGATKIQKSLTSPGLTREEHKLMAKEIS